MIRPGKFQSINQYGKFRVPGSRNEGNDAFWKQAVLAAIPAFVGGVVPLMIEHFLVSKQKPTEPAQSAESENKIGFK